MTVAARAEAAAAWLEAQAAKSGWRRALYAFVFGLTAALAFAPTGIFPLFALCFPALIILLRGTRSALGAFVTGWSFAFGYFLLGLYWIAASMFVDIAQFWWAVPLAVAGLPALCAIYYGLIATAARRIGLNGLAGAVTFALLWFLADYARGHLLTGFPWNLAGYVWSDVLPVMQSVSVFGIYGLSLLTMLLACLPVVVLESDKRSGVALSLGIVVMTVLVLGGMARLADGPQHPLSTRVRVVQPNIEQELKWNTAEQEVHFHELLDATSAPSAQPLAAIIWPETASTFYLQEDAEHRRAIAANLPQGAVVLTGVIRRSLGEDGRMHYANAMVAVDRSGRIAAAYDKAHLVPFGEYIPFRSILPLRTLAHLGLDFTPGPGPRTLHLEGVPSFSPFICYEAIFPQHVASRDDRPQLLINFTNDGWYGHTAGPYQHFAIARTRAIEEGLPMLRSANTGISAVIDGYGRIMVKLSLGQRGFIDADIPPALPPTLFVRYGECPLWVMFAVMFGSIVVLRYYRLAT